MSNNVLDINQIKNLIPHRYPFLLIDRVLELTENKVVALKNVTVNEEFFNGHFPGHPVMPGVLILEAMAQSAAVFAAQNKDNKGKMMYFASVEKVHFRKPVVPGDSLLLHVEKDRVRGHFWKIRGEAFVGQDKVADAVFSAMLVEKEG